VGDALAILRITQGVTSTCTTMGLTAAFEMLMWALAGRPEGIPFMRFLGIAPTTTIIGVISLVVSRVTELKDRLWSILR
jgi:L-alanine-DL-glutamate epimerase-like enolase superfamily enzyme